MIRDLLQHREDWDNVAVINGEKQFLYSDLKQTAIAIQKVLSQKTCETIAILLPNSGDYIAVLFGTLMAGMTAFPLNTMLTSHEIAPLLEQASVQVIFTSEIFGSLLKEVSDTVTGPLRIIYIEELSTCEDEILPLNEKVQIDEPMIFFTTSGTTGKAKIVQLSEKNIESSMLGYLYNMDYQKIPKDKIRYTLGAPFSSPYGLMIIMVCMMKSFPLIVMKEAFTLDIFYKTIEDHKVSHYEGATSVPLLMEQMADRPIPYDTSSLMYIGFGGSKVTSYTLSNLSQRYPKIEFWPGYGMTEASPLISKPYKQVNKNKLDSVGLAIKGMTIMIDLDGHITNSPYKKGEIIVKGPNVMLGYYKNEAETRRILKHGYLYTGDIGYLDEDGNLYICGRKKNVIIVRGFSVYPEEIEACILNSGLVKDCIVYGEAEASGNEVVRADIIPMTPQIQTDQIYCYCQIHLSSYKQPKKIQVVDTIKKTVTNKTGRTIKTANESN